MKTRQKSKKTLKQVLSLFLAVLMLTGTMELGFGGLKSLFTVKADAATSGSLTRTTPYTGAAKIVVPETIYLTPSTATTGMTDFQYSINNVLNSSGGINLEASATQNIMKFYFKCDGAKLKSVKLSSGTATMTEKSVVSSSDGLASPYSKTDIDLTTDSSYALSTGLTSGQSGTIKWTFTYTDSNSVSRTVYAYTTVYAPLVGANSAVCNMMSIRVRDSADNSNYANIARSNIWCIGIHDIQATNHSAGVGLATGAPDHSMKDSPITNSTFTNKESGRNETADDDSCDLIHDNGKGFSGYYESKWQRNSKNDPYRISASYTGYWEGVVYGDKDRYTNLNQIPNLRIGIDLHEFWSGIKKQSNGKYSLGYYEENGTASSTNAISLQTSIRCTDVRVGYTDAYRMSISVASAEKYVIIHGYEYNKGDYAGTDVIGNMYLYVRYIPVDKSGLRATIQDALEIQEYANVVGEPWTSALQNMLSGASCCLGKPNATKAEVDAISNELAQLTNIIKSYVNNTSYGTATATYKCGSTTIAQNDEIKYSFGDTVSVSPKSIAGYKNPEFSSSSESGISKYSDINLFSLDQFYWTPASRTGKNVSKVEIQDTNSDGKSDELIFTSTSGSDCTDNYTTMSHMNTTPDFDRYYVMLEPSTKYKMSWNVTGTTAQVFVFFMDKDGKYISLADNGKNINTKEISFTTPSTCYYACLRFGNTTANSKTTFSNIQLKYDDTEFAPAANQTSYVGGGTAMTFNYAYTAKQFTITFRANNGTFADDTTNTINHTVTYGKTDWRDMSTSTDKFPPKRTGYTFTGFFDASTGGNMVYDSNCQAKQGTGYWDSNNQWCHDGAESAPVNLYAQWTPNKYTVTFNENHDNLGVNLMKLEDKEFTVNVDDDYSMNVNINKTTGVITLNGTAKSNYGTILLNNYDMGEFAAGTYTLSVTYLSGNAAGSTVPYFSNANSETSTWSGNGHAYIENGDYNKVSITLTQPGHIYATFAIWSNDGGGVYEEEKIKVKLESGESATAWSANAFDVTYGYTMPQITPPSRTGYTFQGYFTEPNGGGTKYYAKTGDSAQNWDIAADTTLYAHWTANTDTAYTVEHYVMGTDGKYPTNATSTDNLTGTTGATLTFVNLKKTDAAYNVTGGIAYSYGKVGDSTATETTIAADGSTVVKLYYARSAYKLKFTKGTGIDSATITVNSSTTVQPNTETTVYYDAPLSFTATASTGYKDVTWSATYTKMPAQDVTGITVSATAKDITYTVEHYVMGTNGSYPTTATSSESKTAKADSTLTPTAIAGFATGTVAGGIEYDYAKVGDTKVTANVTVPTTDNSLTIKLYYKRISHTVTVTKGTGISAVNGLTQSGTTNTYTGSFRYGASLSEITATAATGYNTPSFSPAIPTTMGTSDITSTVSATANTDTPYTVEHYVMGTDGQYPSTANATDNLTGTTGATLTLADKKKTSSDYYVAGGIEYSYGTVGDSTATETTIAPDGSTEIKLYYARSAYKLEFTKGTGIDSATITVNSSTTVQPNTETTVYYDAPLSFTATASTGYKDVTWSATYTKMPAQNVTDITVSATAKEYTITLNDSQNGATTNGQSSVKVNYKSFPATVTTLPKKEYTVSFDTDGATSTTPSSQTKTYTFKGYYDASTGGHQYINASGVGVENWTTDNDGTLYSQWTAPSSMTITLPAAPTKAGYTFVGWYDGNTIAGNAGATYTVTKTVELKAKWNVNVTFNANGHGTAPAGVNVAIGGKISAPIAPTATGYTFMGWYKEAACTNQWNFSSDTVSTPTILYAKWVRTSATICALEEVQVIDEDGVTIDSVTAPSNAHGTVSITDDEKGIKFTPTDMTWSEPETFTVTFSKGGTRDITVYPQTNVLYEETACNSVDTDTAIYNNGKETVISKSYAWTRVGSAPSGDKGNSTSKVYGYSNAYENKDNYSAGYAYCSTVSSSDDGYAYYNFTFTGTGFDIVGMCDNQSGLMAVQITQDEIVNGVTKKNIIETGFINTYHSGGQRYQEVVYHKYNLPYGTYNVSVAAYYDPIFDFTGYKVVQAAGYNTVVPENGSIIEVPGIFGKDYVRGTYYCVDSESYRAGNTDIVDFEPVTVGAKTTVTGDYNVTIDGVRIYNSGNVNNDGLVNQYTTDNELNPTYARLVDILNNESVNATSIGTLYVEATQGDNGKTTEWSVYSQVGSKSEVQLLTGNKASTQMISLQASGYEKLHISLKAVEIPTNTHLYAVVNGHEFEIISKTEQYYNVTDWVNANGGVLTIACVLRDNNKQLVTDKQGILAICNFKYFETPSQDASTESAVIFESTENALLSAKTMMTAMYKPKAEDMVFTVDFGDYGTTQVRVKKEYVKVEQVNGEWTATAKLSEKTLEELLENMGITDDYGIDGKGITLTAKRVGDEWQTERATVKIKKLNLFEKLVQKIVRFFTLVIERITQKFRSPREV